MIDQLLGMAAKFKQFAKIKMITDRYLSLGVSKDMVGNVLEIYDDDHYEIAITDPQTGNDIAQFSVSNYEIIEIDDIEES